MNLADVIEARTLTELYASDSIKWSQGAIGAFVAEMDFGIDPHIARALHQAVDSATFGYWPPRIHAELKEATAHQLAATHGWQVPAEDIFPVADVLAALEVTITEFTAPGAAVIVPTPAYMPFLDVPRRLGREVIEVPLIPVAGRWEFDLAGVDAAFAAGGELLLLCNPHNPLGRVFTRAELQAISTVVDQHTGRVFADEIWSPLIFDNAAMVSYATVNAVAAAHTVTAISASKAWNLPGLKCAQLVVSNDADRRTMAALAGQIGHGTANLGAVAAIAAYREGAGWLADVLSYLDGNRQELMTLVHQLPGVQAHLPEGTYVAWLDFTATGIDDPVRFFREHAGVALTEGRACGQVGRGHGRFIFAMPRPVMRQALSQMADAIRTRT